MRVEHPRATIGRTQLDWLLRVAVAGALVGHGAYGAVLAKASWYGYFAVLGVSESVVEATGLLRIVGGAEIALGMIALVFPMPALLLLVAAWKIFTELLRPAAGKAAAADRAGRARAQPAPAGPRTPVRLRS